MSNLDTIYSKGTLGPALGKVHSVVTKELKALSLDDLFEKPGNRWSPADTLRHLNKSVAPVVLFLSLPKLFLLPLFGRSKRKSKKLSEIDQIYSKALADGAQAGRYAPSAIKLPMSEEEAEKVRKKIISKWIKLGERLLLYLHNWNEEDLDKYQLPHPILGKLTMREILMFTIIHNLHHLEKIQERTQNKGTS